MNNDNQNNISVNPEPNIPKMNSNPLNMEEQKLNVLDTTEPVVTTTLETNNIPINEEQQIQAQVLEQQELIQATENTQIPSMSVESTVSPNGTENKPKKNKTLIVIIAVIAVIILFIVYNFFIRLSGKNNIGNAIENVFTSVSNVLKSNKVEEINTLSTSGNAKLNIDGTQNEYYLDYSLGIDIKNLILYLGTNVTVDKSSLLNAIAYFKDNILYFKLSNNGKVYYYKAEDSEYKDLISSSEITYEEIEKYYNEDDITYLLEVYSKGASSNLDESKISRSVDGLSLETTYIIDETTLYDMIINGLKSIAEDEKALNILKETYEITKEYIDSIIENYDKSKSEITDEEEIGKLVIYNNIITGVITKAQFRNDSVYIEIVPGTQTEISMYTNDKKVLEIKYSKDKIETNMDFSTDTDTITFSSKNTLEENKIITTGNIEYKDSQGTTIKVELNNTFEKNGTIKSLDTTSAINFETITEEEKEELLFTPLIEYVSGIYGELNENEYSEYYNDTDNSTM